MPVLLALSLAAPSLASAEEPIRPLSSRPEVYPPRVARARIAIAGLTMTAGFWALSLGASSLHPDAPGASSLAIPVAGPWMALAETGCPDDEPDCALFPVVLRAVLTSIDAVAQVGGLAIASESAWLRTAPRNKTGFRATPMAFGRAGVGLGVRGRF
ncbi:MAG: hypothetical protein JW751_05025 [Polyangiaceae bacterium]|nr:hypothetical protein [Polyangiaceae bacterium]